MIVPEYWAEAKERVVIDGRKRTFKRFGWSDVSEAEALANATERVEDAARRAKLGEKIRLVDHKVAYNGAEGLPIREEIISRRDDCVITRNSYGAACLNTPDVLFGDVDIPEQSYAMYGWIVFALFVATAFLLPEPSPCGSDWLFWATLIIGVIVAGPIGYAVRQLVAMFQPKPFDAALARIEAFGKDNSGWVLRIYRTPNGYRVLAMHDTFDPTGDEAHRFMKAIGGDPLYATMCRNQKCFRARVSPKPWRIGIDKHLRPRPGVWPIAEERMGDRRQWVRAYEAKATRFASCRYEKSIGAGMVSRKCEAVQRLHDDLCRAESGLPIA